jgi:hypothetical protein
VNRFDRGDGLPRADAAYIFSLMINRDNSLLTLKLVLCVKYLTVWLSLCRGLRQSYLWRTGKGLWLISRLLFSKIHRLVVGSLLCSFIVIDVYTSPMKYQNKHFAQRRLRFAVLAVKSEENSQLFSLCLEPKYYQVNF